MKNEEAFDLMDKLLQPSTIKGIVALIGAVLIFFMKPAEANNWATNISNILFALYGLYQIFRNESAQLMKAVNKITNTGAAILLIILILPLATANAQEICFEPIISSGTYTLKIDDGTPIPDLPFTAYSDPDGDWHCVDNVLDYLSGGQHTFQVMAVDPSGWEGEWSSPFVAYRPGQSTKWKIRK